MYKRNHNSHLRSHPGTPAQANVTIHVPVNSPHYPGARNPYSFYQPPHVHQHPAHNQYLPVPPCFQ